MQKDLFFNIDDPKGGISRELAPGINTTVYTGDQAMISVVRFDPNSRGKMHEHPEEQWGYCVSVSVIRFQNKVERAQQSQRRAKIYWNGQLLQETYR